MLYTNIAFLMCALFLISKTRVCDSIEVQLEIKGVSDRLKGKLEKYHSPLNNPPWIFYIIYYCRMIRINQLS